MQANIIYFLNKLEHDGRVNTFLHMVVSQNRRPRLFTKNTIQSNDENHSILDEICPMPLT